MIAPMVWFSAQQLAIIKAAQISSRQADIVSKIYLGNLPRLNLIR